MRSSPALGSVFYLKSPMISQDWGEGITLEWVSPSPPSLSPLSLLPEAREFACPSLCSGHYSGAFAFIPTLSCFPSRQTQLLAHLQRLPEVPLHLPPLSANCALLLPGILTDVRASLLCTHPVIGSSFPTQWLYCQQILPGQGLLANNHRFTPSPPLRGLTISGAGGRRKTQHT